MKYLEERIKFLKQEYSNNLDNLQNFEFGSFDRLKIWTKVLEIKHRIDELKLVIKNIN